nr:MAG TPA: hypothetical protein [Caudoviricetes sp.]
MSSCRHNMMQSNIISRLFLIQCIQRIALKNLRVQWHTNLF